MKTAGDAGVRTLPWVEPSPQSERQFYSAPSACGGMYTANTMASAVEALGMALPGNSSIPAVDRRKGDDLRNAGLAVMELLRRGILPRDIMTREAFLNAIRVVINKAPMHGRELTAKDVEYNLHRVFGLGSGWTAERKPPVLYGDAGTNLPVESITATDKYTVVMKLKEPLPIGGLNIFLSRFPTNILPPRS